MSVARLAVGLPLAGAFILVLGPPRRIAQAHGWDWGRSAPFVFQRLLCWMLRIHVRRRGAPRAVGPRLLVSNHLSWMDIPILGAVEPLAFLAKKEIGERFLGRLCAGLQGVVYVDRQRKRRLPSTNAEIAAAMRAGRPIVLFPEATTSDGNRILRFRSSHFEAAREAGPDSVVQPVYLDYRRLGGLVIARRDWPTVAWYGDMTFWPHLMGILRSGGVSCDVHYGEPIRAAEYPDAKALKAAAEAAVRGLRERARADASR